MSRSEDILLTVKHVKHKKSEGTLYMMESRMGWMLSSKDTFNISLNYVDIKGTVCFYIKELLFYAFPFIAVQKVSPDTKEKVQLQVVMHDGGATTFHFVNPAGRSAQVKDREGVKELLQQLLPKCRRKINSELEEKNRYGNSIFH
jgi:transcription initiation factor TFIIH subunit 1